MPEQELASLKRIYSAISRWDVDEFADNVAHDFEMVLPDSVPWGGTHHGKDGLRAFSDVFRDHVEGQWADPDEFIDDEDSIVVLGRMRGRAIDTGRDYEVHFVHVWRLPDGVPSRCRSYFDSVPILDAMGHSARSAAQDS
jgi:uncharacterized protein